MTTTAAPPELEIIVPILNEAAALAPFVEDLSRQREVHFFLQFVDGGSRDGSRQVVAELAPNVSFPISLCESAPGRARQLNAASRQAAAPWLLFLHVDSRIADPLALRRGIDSLSAFRDRQGHCRAAGHFALRFADRGDGSPLGYYFYETKARLNRPECTHGDQGFLLARSFFQEVGPFDESLPILEDTRLAERIRAKGRWVLLPAEIQTSARRFAVEGLAGRQVLNALIMNFAAIGWTDFFREAAAIYRSQDQASRLELLPYLEKILELLTRLSWRRRLQLWYLTGCYVRRHGWQLALAWDARRNFRRGIPPAGGALSALAVFDRWFDRLTDNPLGRSAAALLVWVWFHLLRLFLRLIAKSP